MQALAKVRTHLVAYLGSKSLVGFQHFFTGYSLRCGSEAGDDHHDPRMHGFHRFVCERFHIDNRAASTHPWHIVASYSKDDADAFDRYFRLMEEFLTIAPPPEPRSPQVWPKRSFIELMKAIRERPAMFLGSVSFFGLRLFLAGDEQAGVDLKLPPDPDRELLHGFHRWIEAEQNHGDPRPWFKIIECWGWTDVGAYKLFFAYLDDYVKLIGRPDLFRVELERGVH